MERLLRDSGCFCSRSHPKSPRVLILTCCGGYFRFGSILAQYATILLGVLFLEPNLRILSHFRLFSSRISILQQSVCSLGVCSMFCIIRKLMALSKPANSAHFPFSLNLPVRASNLPGNTYQGLLKKFFSLISSFLRRQNGK